MKSLLLKENIIFGHKLGLFLFLFFGSINNISGQNGWTIYPNSPYLTSFEAITVDNFGRKLISTNHSGLLMTYDGNNYDTLKVSNSGLISNQLVALAVDNNNVYWIATLNAGLVRYDGNTWTNYNTNNSNIITNNLKNVFCSGNKVYVGSYSGFSILYNGTFNNYNVTNSTLVSDSIYAFALDNNNNLFIATNKGLSKFDGLNFTTFDITNSGLLDNLIYSLYFDGQDIWIGTKTKGVFKYLVANNQIKSIKEIFDTPIVFTSNNFGSYPIRSICMGPHGGVCFANYRDRIYEIFQNQIYTYYNSNGPYSNSTIIVFDNQSQLIYLYGGIYTKLTSFDYTIYNGYANGNTYGNYKALDINEVSAAITNRGDMFWDVDIQIANFKVPKNENKTAIFMNSIWLAGLDQNNNLHTAAQTYRQNGTDYWPGPLDTIVGETDTTTAVLYDKIWKINWFDIEQFRYFFDIGAVQNGSWLPSNDILTWPARGAGNYTRNMAPFVDVNNDGIYNPIQDGDYPQIKGDQMLYWIFNDNLGPHTESGGSPLKVEVHASAYAFGCPELYDADSTINYTTFYHYKIFNRSSLNYDSCYIGNLTDFDLGLETDDAISCDPEIDLAFCYNFDNNDGNGNNQTYGINPPVIGSVVLNAPTDKMNNFIAYANSVNSINGNPTDSIHFYNYLRGFWRDGTNLTLGGNGIGGNVPTHFIYSGTFESMIPWYPVGGSDVRSLQSSGPFSFPANSSIDYDFAIVYARDTVGNDSPQLFQQLFDNAARAKTWFDDNTFPSCIGPASIKENLIIENTIELFPNPTVDILNFRSLPGHLVKEVRIYNAMGKEVYFNPIVNTNEIFVGNKALGIYLLSVKYVDGSISTNKFIKQ